MTIVTFGEIMLRLTPPQVQRFAQATHFEIAFGGGEANVAVSLAHFGHSARFVSKLPTHAIGEAAVADLRKEGVDVTRIARGGNRLGLYYLEKGASQRASQVIYDRADSSIATAQPEDFDWEAIFDGASWFHFTGITPALSAEATRLVKTALTEAKRRAITVSCDLNYRKKLWSTQQAGQVMSELMPMVDVLIANEEDAEKVFGIKAEHTQLERGELDRGAYVGVAKMLSERFSIPTIAITLRTSLSADDNIWSGMVYTKGTAYFAPSYRLHIVDRVGGGDSFAAGLIHAMLQGEAAQQVVDFAVAASALKHSIEGDYNRVSIDEVHTLMKGDGSGRVVR